MHHSPGFLKLVDDAKSRIQEISIEAARKMVSESPGTVLLDVREESEWRAGHAREAQHLGKGILERDIEVRFPEKQTEIIMYCGGGYRSALTCDAAQRIGYGKVYSLIGGYKAMLAAGWEMVAQQS